jgi:hypothetical protein
MVCGLKAHLKHFRVCSICVFLTRQSSIHIDNCATRIRNRNCTCSYPSQLKLAELTIVGAAGIGSNITGYSKCTTLTVFNN